MISDLRIHFYFTQKTILLELKMHYGYVAGMAFVVWLQHNFCLAEGFLDVTTRRVGFGEGRTHQSTERVRLRLVFGFNLVYSFIHKILALSIRVTSLYNLISTLVYQLYSYKFPRQYLK